MIEANLRKLEAMPDEFLDVAYVLAHGACKYGDDSWLSNNPAKFSHRANHESMSRHLAESYCGVVQDADSGLSPLLHLACRALMEYTRQRRGIMEVSHTLVKEYKIDE